MHLDLISSALAALFLASAPSLLSLNFDIECGQATGPTTIPWGTYLVDPSSYGSAQEAIDAVSAGSSLVAAIETLFPTPTILCPECSVGCEYYIDFSLYVTPDTEYYMEEGNGG